MSPNESTAAADPVAVIMARMEVKLDAALAEQSRHAVELLDHSRKLETQGNRLTAIETTVTNLPRKAVTPAALISMLSVAVAIIGVLGALLAIGN